MLFTLVWRRFKSDYLFSFIVVLSLILGVLSFYYIYSWFKHEIEYDQFNKNYNRIGRVIGRTDALSVATSMAGMGQYYNANMSEVKSFSRVYPASISFSYNDDNFNFDNALYVDYTFFDLFDFELLSGSLDAFYKGKNSVLISEDFRNSFFSNNDPIGEHFVLEDSSVVSIVGVIKNPEKSFHLDMSVLLPIKLIESKDPDLSTNQWDNFKVFTYLLFNEDIESYQISDLNNKLTQLFRKNVDEVGEDITIEIQPLSKLHLGEVLMLDVAKVKNKFIVFGVGLSALIVFFVACLNSYNLMTVKLNKRSLEFVVKKVLGAEKHDVFIQFVYETLFYILLTFIFSLVLMYFISPYLSSITFVDYSFGLSGILVFVILFIIIFLVFIVNFHLSYFKFSKNNLNIFLKSNYGATFSIKNFKFLIFFQSFVSVFLIFSTIVVFFQIDFIRKFDLGFNRDSMISVPLGNVSVQQFRLFNNLLGNSNELDYAFSEYLPLNINSGTSSVYWQGKQDDFNPIVANSEIDENFVSLFDIEILAGRNFSSLVSTDSNNFIVNQRFANFISSDYSNVVGSKVKLWDREGVVVGVIKDFNFKKLDSSIEPLIFSYIKEQPRYLIFNYDLLSMDSNIALVGSLFSDVFYNKVFSYSFLEDDFLAMYKDEFRLFSIVPIFSFLSLFISIIGFVGLSVYLNHSRKKEFSIRKVIGASNFALIVLIFKEFFKIYFVASVFSLSISYFVMNSWLEDFSFKIGLSPFFFIVSFLIPLVLMFLTIFVISYSTIYKSTISYLK